jgi:hypothetical protein
VINRALAKDHVCQRRRKDVVEWFSTHAADENPFPARDQKEVAVDLAFPEERTIINELGDYGPVFSILQGGMIGLRFGRWPGGWCCTSTAGGSPLRVRSRYRLKTVEEDRGEDPGEG